MAAVATFVLIGLSFAAVFVSFVVGRLLAGRAFRVGDRVAPFGEARPSGFDRARPGARLAITLAGPLAIYVYVAALCVAGFALGAGVEVGTTVESVVSASPAAAAGLQRGDRLISVAGRPTRVPAEVRAAVLSAGESAVEVLADREGRQLRLAVVSGADHKLGITFGPNLEPVSLVAAIRRGGAFPGAMLITAVEGTIKREAGEVMGPIGFVRATAHQTGGGDRLLMIGSGATAGLLVFVLAALALWPPRTRGGAEPPPADVPVPVMGATRWPARPGVRLAARAVDWLLIWLLVGLTLPSAMALSPLVWLPIEALLLSRWGFTPGKWLLRIAVRDQQGRRPTFRGAFRRGAVAWTYGVGAFTPFGLATAVMAYVWVNRRGTTYWDSLGGFEVHHHPVGVARAVAAAVVLGGAIAIFRSAQLW